jgi:hypothetical protein
MTHEFGQGTGGAHGRALGANGFEQGENLKLLVVAEPLGVAQRCLPLGACLAGMIDQHARIGKPSAPTEQTRCRHELGKQQQVHAQPAHRASAVGKNGGETARAFLDERRFPILVQDDEFWGWDAAGDDALSGVHGMGWADRSSPGRPVDPTRTVGHARDEFHLLGTDPVAHAASLSPRQHSRRRPAWLVCTDDHNQVTVVDGVGRVLIWCAGKSGRRRTSRRLRSLMLATTQWMLRRNTRGLRALAEAGTIGRLGGRRRRPAWAKAVQQLLDAASRQLRGCPVPREWEAPLLCAVMW